MEIDLNKISWEELLNEIGLYISTDHLLECFNDEKVKEKIGKIIKEELGETDQEELEETNQEELGETDQEKLEEKNQEELDKDGSLTASDISELISENIREFDKAKYVFYNYLIVSGIKEENNFDPAKEVRNRNKKLKTMIQILEKYPAIVVDIENLPYQIYDSRDLFSQKRKEEHKKDKKDSEERINEIEETLKQNFKAAEANTVEEIDISYLLMPQILSDVDIYTTDTAVGEAIKTNTIIRSQRKGATAKEIYDDLSGKRPEQRDFREYVPAFKEEVLKYSEYIDWDTFLLLVAYRLQDNLENIHDEEFMTPENIAAVTRIIEICKEKIRNPKTKISSQLEDKFGGKKYVNFSYKDLCRILDRKVVGEIYYGDPVLEMLRNQLEEGIATISDVKNIKLLKLILNSPSFIEKCSKRNKQNAIELYNREIIKSTKLKMLLADEDLSEEITKQISELKDEKEEYIYTNKELIDMYLNGQIELLSIAQIERIKDELTEEELMYKYVTLSDQTEEEQAKTEKYISLYREVKIANKSNEEKKEIGNQLVLELDSLMEEEDFIDLYKRNLIPLETIVDWNSDEFAMEMFKKGILKPDDAKKLFRFGNISVEQIKSGLLDGLSDEEKLSLIITLFDDEKQEDLRNELFQSLDVEVNFKSKIPDKRPINPDPTPGGKGKTYEIDPCYKAQLLSAIDKDYRARMTKDGHMIFELPNYNIAIIEKMFKKEKKQIAVATGAATYFVPLNLLNSENIITDNNKINRSRLYQLVKQNPKKEYDGSMWERIVDQNQTERTYHTEGWGREIYKIFDIEQSPRHTKEDKDKIIEIVKKCERTRKLQEK